MSKHPRYLAVDEKRIEVIPIAFEKYASNKFTIKKIQPVKEEGSNLPWPHFLISDDKGEVAIFYASGKSECYKKSFKKIHEKMVKYIEKAAYEMKIEVEKDERRENAEKHGFDPTFYEKEKEFLETQKK